MKVTTVLCQELHRIKLFLKKKLKIKEMLRWTYALISLTSKARPYKDSSMKTRLYNIFKTRNTTALIKTISESHYRVNAHMKVKHSWTVLAICVNRQSFGIINKLYFTLPKTLAKILQVWKHEVKEDYRSWYYEPLRYLVLLELEYITWIKYRKKMLRFQFPKQYRSWKFAAPIPTHRKTAGVLIFSIIWRKYILFGWYFSTS